MHTSCRLGLSAFVVPFLFAMEPALIGVGDGTHIARAAITALIGVMALAGGNVGYVFYKTVWWERVLLIGGALLCLDPGFFTDLIGLVMIAAALANNVLRGRKNKSMVASGTGA